MKITRLNFFISINRHKLEVFIGLSTLINFRLNLIRLKGERNYKLLMQIPFITLILGIVNEKKELKVL